MLATLLDDSSVMVLGSAVAAYNEICPMSFHLIHPCYRKLCHLLPDMDEWTQAPVLNLMTRYVRTFFTDPSSSGTSTGTSTKISSTSMGTSGSSNGQQGTTTDTGRKTVKRRVMKAAFYSDDEGGDSEEEKEVAMEQDNSSRYEDTHTKAEMGSVFTGVDADAELGANLAPDHSLLLKTSISLLKSRNACVVLAVCTLHHYCGPQTTITNTQIGKALIRILKNSRETQYVVLSSIKTFAQDYPFIFAPYLTDFFIKLSDPLFNK
jgi:AP-3 complex subunit beta